MKVLNVIKGTVVDGIGLRTSIYLAGCNHHCEGCQNPQSWDCNPKEYLFDTEEDLEKLLDLIDEVNEDPLISGITLTGGDPLYDQESALLLISLINEILKSSKTIWLYTGYLYEDLMDMQVGRDILSHVDVVVDGKFMKDQRDPTLAFRGSKNQRIIDVKKSMKENKIIELFK